ncbi:MAG TPA: hypothetical protein VK117_17055 [Pyrinomonadaceae bacterium]|nr:hypothetical protein [Pyrinomonadaceae bacterium]
MRTAEEIQVETNRLKVEYGKLFDAVAELLFRHDPIGINFEDNEDEYYPEVRTILPLLKTCHSPEEVLDVVHGEFVRWFDQETAGSKEHYSKIAHEIWLLWQNRQGNSKLTTDFVFD